MKAREYIGVIPPMLSSFTRDGDLYEKGLREIVRYLLPHVQGLYPCGTYGSGPMMSIAPRTAPHMPISVALEARGIQEFKAGDAS